MPLESRKYFIILGFREIHAHSVLILKLFWFSHWALWFIWNVVFCMMWSLERVLSFFKCLSSSSTSFIKKYIFHVSVSSWPILIIIIFLDTMTIDFVSFDLSRIKGILKSTTAIVFPFISGRFAFYALLFSACNSCQLSLQGSI